MHEQEQYTQPYHYSPMPPNKQKNNTALIAIIAVLGVIIVTMLILGTLFFTGVIAPGETEEEPIPTDNVTESAEIQAVNMYVANVKNSIYFRSAPSEDQSNIICEIPVGSSVTFLENTDVVFAKILYNGQNGYVKREYLSSAPPTATPSNTNVLYNMYVGNVKYSIYLRSAPSENGSIICEIPLGTPVGFIETANSTFSMINYNGTIGYSKTEYLVSSPPSAHTTYLTVCNVKHSIYLRKSPSENGGIICEIPVGSTVRYISTPNSTFTEIEWNGNVGYSKTEYLR